jgi:hypothetical protein
LYRKTIRRGGRYTEEEYRNDTKAIRRFREEFIKNILNEPVNVKKIIGFFDKTRNIYLETRRHNLFDTLIPVNKDNNVYVPVVDKEEAQDYVPVTCLIVQRVHDIKDIIKIVRAYRDHEGNLDLDSWFDYVSIIDTAFEMKNFVLINYLMTLKKPPIYVPYYVTEYYKENGLDPTYPPPLPPIVKDDYELEPSILPPAPPVKRKTQKKSPSEIIQYTPPMKSYDEPDSGKESSFQLDSPFTRYSPGEEPAFWLSVFKTGELFQLRRMLSERIDTDLRIKVRDEKMSEMWGICSILQNIIPKFNVPQDIPKPYSDKSGLYVVPSVAEFSEYNIILCSTFLIYGILSYKLRMEDYRIIMKGGKGVQLALSKLTGVPHDFKYESEDIDILILSKDGVEHNASRAQTLASHIAYLIEWLLSDVFTNKISVLLPSDPNARNTSIVKLSYFSNGFKQFSDISFEALSESVKPFFENTIRIDKPTPFGKVKFIFQSTKKIISEKQFFISEYSKLLNNPMISKRDESEYKRIINKFERTIREIERATDTVKK